MTQQILENISKAYVSSMLHKPQIFIVNVFVNLHFHKSMPSVWPISFLKEHDFI